MAPEQRQEGDTVELAKVIASLHTSNTNPIEILIIVVVVVGVWKAGEKLDKRNVTD